MIYSDYSQRTTVIVVEEWWRERKKSRLPMRPFARALSTSARRPVYVIGVGMTKFNKPGTSGMDYPALVKAAGQAALADASVTLDDVEQVLAALCIADHVELRAKTLFLSLPRAMFMATQLRAHALCMSWASPANRFITSIQTVPLAVLLSCWLSRCAQWYLASALPLTPLYPVVRLCTCAIFLFQLIAGGLAECTMAVGFEKMQMGSLSFNNSDREGPIDHFMTGMSKLRGGEAPGKVPGAPWLFGAAGACVGLRYQPQLFLACCRSLDL